MTINKIIGIYIITGIPFGLAWLTGALDNAVLGLVTVVIPLFIMPFVLIARLAKREQTQRMRILAQGNVGPTFDRKPALQASGSGEPTALLGSAQAWLEQAQRTDLEAYDRATAALASARDLFLAIEATDHTQTGFLAQSRREHIADLTRRVFATVEEIGETAPETQPDFVGLFRKAVHVATWLQGQDPASPVTYAATQAAAAPAVRTHCDACPIPLDSEGKAKAADVIAWHAYHGVPLREGHTGPFGDAQRSLQERGLLVSHHAVAEEPQRPKAPKRPAAKEVPAWHGQVTAALRSLGYSATQAKQAVVEVAPTAGESPRVADMLRAALATFSTARTV